MQVLQPCFTCQVRLGSAATRQSAHHQHAVSIVASQCHSRVTSRKTKTSAVSSCNCRHAPVQEFTSCYVKHIWGTVAYLLDCKHCSSAAQPDCLSQT
jgi:hypothetical protein